MTCDVSLSNHAVASTMSKGQFRCERNQPFNRTSAGALDMARHNITRTGFSVHTNAANGARKRYERLKQARKSGTHTGDQWDMMLEFCNHICVACEVRATDGVFFLQKDHIIPLAMGGSDTIENLQPLCTECNGSKGARSSIDYRPAGWRKWVYAT